MPPRAERLLHLVIAIAAGAWLVLRAACVPLTHDEAATFQTYVLTGVYLPWQAHLDAGNHLLASAATRISYLLFGDGPLALRLFSVLAFGLWAWYAWRITRGMASAALRIAASCALLLTPFVFEFFALFRGYGPALAFLLMALHHAMAYWHRAQRIDLLLALLAASIATAASLNMLVIGAMLFGMAALRTGMSRQRDAVAWATLVLVGALPLVALAQYGAELAAQDLLYYGSADGIVHGTLASLGAWVIGLHWPLASAALFVLPLLLAAFSLRSSPNRHVLAMLMLLFAGELLARWVLATGRGVLYPTDRTAMHLVPLAILLFAYAADSARSAITHGLAAAMLALLPFRALLHMNLDHTSFWPEQAITKNLFDAAEERQRMADRPLLVGGYHQSACVWTYESMRRGATLNFMDVNGFPQPTCDLLLLDPGYFEPPLGFMPVAEASHGRATLYERVPPLRLAPVLDTALASFEGDSEYHELPALLPDSLVGSEWLLELDARFTSAHDLMRLRIVIEVKDAEGGTMHYEANDFERLQTSWQGDRLRVLRRIPRFSAPPARAVAYLWNPWRQAYRMEDARVRLSRVVQ